MEPLQRTITMRGGRIVLHTRADDKHGIWQCRLRLGNDRKLVRRSTRTSDLNEAKRTAEEIYDELRYKQQNQQSLTAATFKKAAELNERPRKTLDFDTPAERFNARVAAIGLARCQTRPLRGIQH